MFVANFTPDSILWTHIGVSGTLEPGDIEEFDDARGKHILNKWGQRGLLRLDYADKDREEEKREEAMKIYNNFWEEQATRFNQQNMQRENENMSFVPPTRELRDKAKELGIELKSPWTPTATPSAADNAKVLSLESQVGELKDMVGKLADLVKVSTQQRDDALIGQFSGMNDIDFRAYVFDNLGKIVSYPVDVQNALQSKWKATQGDEMWPLES